MAETPPLPPVSPVAAPLPPSRGDTKAAVIEATENLQQIARPIRVEGVVTQINRDGTVTIATDQGDLTLAFRPPRALLPGQAVEIDLQPGAPPRAAVVRTIDTPSAPPVSQQSPATPASQPAPAGTPPPPRLDLPALLPQATEAPALPAAALLQNGQSARLLPLPPGETVYPLPPGPPAQSIETRPQIFPFAAQPVLTVKAEAQALFQPLTVAPPTGGAPPIPVFTSVFAATPLLPEGLASFPVFQAAAQIAFTASTPGALSSPSAQGLPLSGALALRPLLFSSGPLPAAPVMPEIFHGQPHKIDIQVQTVQTASSIFPFPAKAAPLFTLPLFAGQAGALVEGFTAAGLPVLSLSLAGHDHPQSFILQFPASNVAQGARIILTPQPGPAAGTAAALDLTTGNAWPVLDDVAAALAYAAPQAMPSLVQTVPNPALPAQIPAAALLFLAAVRAGDPGLWLGERSMEMLKRAGKSDLIARLSGDMGTVNRASSDPVAQDWKAMPMPLYYDGQMQKAMLWFRQDGQKGEKDVPDSARSTRFIFDLALSRMGAVQLDGLAKGQRIDLIVRTLKSVTPEMRQAMRQKYMHVLEQADFTGELSFQDSQDRFVKIPVSAL